MDLRKLSELLGGTVWPEEHHTDFRAIHEHIAKLKKRLEDNVEDVNILEHCRAEVLFVTGIKAMIQGNYREAHESFQSVTTHDPQLPRRWRNRALLYDHYARIWSIWPPTLRFWSDYSRFFVVLSSIQKDIDTTMNNLETIADDIRKHAFERLGTISHKALLSLPDETFSHFTQGLKADTSASQWAAFTVDEKALLTDFALDKLEVDVLRSNWFAYRVTQLLLGPMISKLVGLDKGSHEEVNSQKQRMDVYRADIQRQKQVARDLDLPLIDLYLDRLLFEVYRVEKMNSSDWLASGLAVLEAVETKHLNRQDWAELASVLVQKGDFQLSPPFSSPFALNLILTDSKDITIENRHWDKVESGMRLNYSKNAQECFQAADYLYEKAQCKQRRSLVHLRQGCISHMIAVYGDDKDQTRREVAFDQAASEFIRAQSQCDPEDQHYRLIQAHRILLEISRGSTNDTKELLDKSAEIGSWSAAVGNIAYGQFIGFLFAKFGQRAWLDRGRSDIALTSYACAEACLREIPGSCLSTLQVSGSLLTLYLSLSNHKQSRAQADIVYQRFHSLLEDLRSFRGHKTWGRQVQHVTLLLLRCLRPLLPRAYFATRDESAIRKWLQEYHELESEFDHGQEYAARARHPYLVQRYEHNHESMTESEYMRRTYGPGNHIVMYYIAQIQYERSLLEYDNDAAEKTLMEFLIPYLNQSVLDDKCLLAIVICNRLGKYDMARELLDTLDDKVLLKGEIDEEDSIDRPWSYIAYRNRLFFPEEAENAVMYCVKVQDWERGKRLLHSILSKDTGFLDVRCVERDREDMWHRFLNAGLIEEFTGKPELAFQYYLDALNSFELRNTGIQGEDARLSSFHTEDSGRLFNALARLAVGFQEVDKELPSSLSLTNGVELSCLTWYLYALSFLEMGRARSLLESKSFRSHSSGIIEEDTINVYRRRLLADLVAIPEDKRTRSESEEIKSLHKTLQAAKSLLNLPSLQPNISPALALAFTSFDFIPADVAVIEFGLSQDGLVLMCITDQGLQYASSEQYTSLEAQKTSFKYLHRIFRRHSQSHTLLDPEVMMKEKENLLELGSILSKHLLQPLEGIIRAKHHLIFIPSHPMHNFPYSALAFEDKPLFRSKAVSQAPSLATLRLLRSSTAIIKMPNVTAIAKPGRWMDRIATEPPLYMAGLEALMIGRQFGTEPHNAETLSTQDFLSLIERGDIIHLGTHGDLHVHSPWQASISLRSKMRVMDMTMSHSQAALFVFGACLAGIGRSTVGSDVTGFSNVILAAGARAFIGALWSVHDVSTFLLMRAFYKLLSQNDGSDCIAELLRQAQCSLFDMSKEALARLRDDLLQDWESMAVDAHEPRPGKFIPKGKSFLKVAESLKSLHESLDVQHPIHWAPFVILGDGTLRFGCK